MPGTPEHDTQRVVVGVDGSPPSLNALDWAYQQSALCHLPLELVMGWPIPARDGRSGVSTAEEARVLGATLARDTTSADSPEVAVWVSPVRHEPDVLLRRRAAHATLLVVGRHARHSLSERLLGSVTEQLLANASCPVAVVSRAPGEHRWNRIVVGVDGSPASQAALCWAVRQAELTDATVAAVHAWHWRPEYGVYPYGPNEQQQFAHAEATLARAVEGLPGGRDRVQGTVVQAMAAAALIEAADEADLLVVGNNRPGHLASHVLGSVSGAVASHSTVPVVVTHAA